MNLNLLRAALFAKSPEGHWGLPLLLWGEPGTGKTSFLRQVGRQYGLAVHRLSPAERGEGQFGVVPVPTTDGYLAYPPPAWARELDGSAGGVIFVDEINTAPPALQAPLLGLVQLRVLGAHTFGSRVRTIAAANEVLDSAGGWDLAPALANRFGHLNVEGLAAADWSVGLLGGFAVAADAVIDAAAEEARVEATLPAHDAAARGLVAGFISRRPDLLHQRPARGAGVASRAWPSRRSVEYAACALASARVQGLTEIETDELLAAFVGEPWVAEFALWRAQADLPDPADVLDGRVKFVHDARRLDRTVAILGACAALVAPTSAANRKARAEACWALVDSVLADAADVAVPAARVLVQARLIAPAIKAATAPLGRLHPILKAAGLVHPGVA